MVSWNGPVKLLTAYRIIDTGQIATNKQMVAHLDELDYEEVVMLIPAEDIKEWYEEMTATGLLDDDDDDDY